MKNNKIMEKRGGYMTDDGEIYDLNWISTSDGLRVKIIGPVPQNGTGTRGIKFEFYAKSEEESKRIIEQKLGPGKFI